MLDQTHTISVEKTYTGGIVGAGPETVARLGKAEVVHWQATRINVGRFRRPRITYSNLDIVLIKACREANVAGEVLWGRNDLKKMNIL